MPLPIAKTAAGLTAIGGVSGLGYLAVKNFPSREDNKSTISKLFSEQGRTLLTKGVDTDQWNARWSEYSKENVWNLKNSTPSTGTAPETFIEKCISNAEVKVFGIEDPLYLDVVKYCSKDFTIEALIGENSGAELLNTADSQDTSGWAAAWKNYLRDNGANENPWNVTGWESAKGDQSAPPSDFRTKCGSKKAEKAYGVKDSKFKNFVDWCTKVKTSQA
ncbi:hypothetical protein MHC_04620 [Mycoplasma haemocanis str. Illinois]|uniref:Uncharacterized protein n=1 Tax=Mycoplasma haemocanis (strain Illinois) TaxID=1111676 RepID=H6N808_MYCHN|nr:hypothetical protein [Mycoplasma haemocanis]AEW45780.1 hypothetical protein MHC_04620 [Mycoplasma haemocanis str. Illinois]